ncbi:MAG: AI-2E family transporter [Deltaproteobacteria bacterium]|nr:AI-2E family transporter [Deltaproteobacteria bacterium]
MEEKAAPEKVDWNQVRRFVVFSASLGGGLILLFLMYRTLLVPVGVSLFLSFLLAPLVAALDKLHMPRSLTVSMLLLLTLAFLTTTCLRVFPALYTEISGLIELVPRAYDKLTRIWLPSIRSWVLELNIISSQEFDAFIRESRTLSYLPEKVNQALFTLWSTAPRLLGLVIHSLLVPLLTFFILKNYDQTEVRIRQLLPRDLEEPLMLFWSRISTSLREVLKGQAMVAATLAVLYVAGLSAVGLQGAVAIGLLSGICRLIPYLDVIVGGSLSLIVVLSDFQGAGQLLAVSGVFLLVQSLDGMLITPRIIGEKTGLHPVLVIVSIVAFGELFGFWGVLLAIPVLAVAKVVWLSAKPFYLASALYAPRKESSEVLTESEQN